MRKAQFTRLSKYEDSLRQAKAGYYRALLREDAEELAAIHTELGYVTGKLNCNRCILAMLQDLAKEFDSYKNKQQKKDDPSTK